MAITQKIVLTALPTGVAASGQLKLSVLVSPRLSTNVANPTLAPFVFNNWAQKVAQLEFDVRIGTKVVRAHAAPGALLPDNSLWVGLFPSSTFVRSFEMPSLKDAKISSYPASNVATFVQNTYTKLGTTSPTELPDADLLIKNGFLGKISPAATIQGVDVGGPPKIQIKNTIKNLIVDTKKLNIKAPSRAAMAPPADFLQAKNFFSSNNQTRQQLKVPGTPGSVDERIDFHQMVALLGQHPRLMRLLGLVFDLELARPSGFGRGAVALVSVTPVGAPAGTNLSFTSPKTHTDVGPFTAKPRPAPSDPGDGEPKGQELKNGMLDLTNKFPDGSKVFDLIHLDPDGAALKLKVFAANVVKTLKVIGLKSENAPKAVARATPRQMSVPALRSPAIALVRGGRATLLASKIEHNFNMYGKAQQSQEVVLYAEDLVRGYAIDIFDHQVNRWFRLTAREGQAKFTTANVTLPIPMEDGWISLTATKAVTDPAESVVEKDLALHEALFRWMGWSLAAPRPGKTLNPDEEVEEVTNTAQTDFKLEVSFDVPAAPEGHLPILRYGRSYRVRARVVDLAGNPTPFGNPTSTSFVTSTAPTTYARLEPIPPPALLMRNLKTESETVERVVIRSNFDKPFTGPSSRHVAAPKTDQVSAEMHGMFDTPTGLDKNAYAMITAREDGTFAETNANGVYVHPGAKSDPNNYGQPYYETDTLVFPLENGQTSGVPYLPDPLAKGAAFRNLPGANPGEVVRIPFDKTPGGKPLTWPNVASFLLKLKEGTELHHTFQGGTMEVSLPKAEMYEVRYNSYHDAAGVPRLGLLRWIAEAAEDGAIELEDDDEDETRAARSGLMKHMKARSRRFRVGADPGDLPTLRLMQKVARDAAEKGFDATGESVEARLAKIVDGTNWLAAPFRNLLLVHAVRQPLVEPKFNNLQAKRLAGWTYADLTDDMTIDFKSTSEVDVLATWTDVIDTGNEPMKQIPVESLAFQHDVSLGPGGKKLKGRHEFYDTKYREVSYSAVATTRFREYFVERAAIKFVSDGGSNVLPPHPEMLGATGVVEGSEIIKGEDATRAGGTITYVRDKDYTMDYVTGTITRKPGTSSIPVGATIDAQYLVPPITRSTAQATVVPILSTARPHAPKVLYIVPTFEWSKSGTATAPQSQRKGRGLRVYLDRPWWSSGAGELLGVVLHSGSPHDPPPNRVTEPYLTQWGLDPLWLANPTTNLPAPTDFELGVATGAGLSLDELPALAPKVRVVGHNVGFDDDRNLWYCDIVLKSNSYFPFVRLALARYQPNSIAKAELSRVTLADFVQLTPDRSATIQLTAGAAHITVVGRSYEKGNLAGPSQIEVTLQERRSEVTAPHEEMGWVDVAGSATVLPVASTSRGGNTTWTGNVVLPVAGKRYRLVIREYERHLTGNLTVGIGGAAQEKARRLVFAETFEIKGTAGTPSPSPSTPSPSPSSPTPSPTQTPSPSPTRPTPTETSSPSPSPTRTTRG